MKRTLILPVTGIVLALFLSNCKKKSSITCDGSAPTYNSYVKAIVDANCVSCHGSYSTYVGLSTITSNGKFEKEVLTYRTMPKGGSLTDDQLTKLQCWVNNGFPEN